MSAGRTGSGQVSPEKNNSYLELSILSLINLALAIAQPARRLPVSVEAADAGDGLNLGAGGVQLLHALGTSVPLLKDD